MLEGLGGEVTYESAGRKTRLVPSIICDTLVADNFVTKEAGEL